MIITSAAKAMISLPPDMWRPLLEKPHSNGVRSVRISPMTNLTEFVNHNFSAVHHEHYQNTIQEYREYLDINEYFPRAR